MYSEAQKQMMQTVRNRFQDCEQEAFFQVNLQEEMLPAEDGIRLKTIIYRPDVTEAVPVVVMRSCYPTQDYLYRVKAEEFARRGIAFVYQYCRGIGGSEGVWEPNVNDRADGMAMLLWLNDQEWADSIGYWGCSYLAFTGWIVADIIPEKVKTMYLTHYGTFRHVSAYKDGLFRQDVLTSWAMSNAGFPVTADFIESAAFMPQMEVDEKLWGGRLEWYRKWITSTDRTAPYWNQDVWELLQKIPGRVKIPVYVGEGWYDHHLGSAIETYLALSEETKKKSVLQIGAWDHSYNVKVDAYKEVGEHFENNDDLRVFRWFWNILKEKKTPEGMVSSYVIGEDRWFENKECRLEGDTSERMYLGNGTLHRACPESGGVLQYDYDPRNPVRTHGAESLLHTAADQGSLLQPEVGSRPDVISFVSEPLEEAMPIYGKIKVGLNVSSDAEDTAFSFKISEVMADGKTYHIRNGITTLGYRNGTDVRIPYNAGEKVEIVIDSWNVAWTVQKGSRIRLDISSSNFPEYAVHSNYPGIWSLQEKTKVARQSVFWGGAEPSYVEFPVNKH